LNSRFNAIAPPMISARSVLIIANSERKYKDQRIQLGNCSRQILAKSLPVTVPSLHANACRKHAKMLDMRITDKSLYRNCAPAETSVE
jgi:hypothetical protein